MRRACRTQNEATFQGVADIGLLFGMLLASVCPPSHAADACGSRSERLSVAFKAVSDAIEDNRIVVGVDEKASCFNKEASAMAMLSRQGRFLGGAFKVGGRCLMTARHVVSPKEEDPAHPRSWLTNEDLKDFFQSDLNGETVEVNYEFNGRKVVRSSKAVVVAAGFFEDATTDFALLLAEDLPETMAKVKVAAGKNRKLADLPGKQVLCFGFSGDKFDANGFHVSIASGKVVGLNARVLGKDGKPRNGGIQTSCVQAGGVSGGFAATVGKDGELQVEGPLTISQREDGVSSDTFERKKGIIQFAPLRQPYGFRTTVADKVVEFVASGACD